MSLVALTFVSGALAVAYNATTTVEEKKYTTIECSTPTTLAYGNKTYTVTEATTLTVEDCGCTHTPVKSAAGSSSVPPAVSTPPNNTAPAVVNGAAAGKVGAAAGVAAAVAYLL